MQKEKLSRNIYLSIITTLFFLLLVAGSVFGLNTARFEEGFSFGQKYRSEKKGDVYDFMLFFEIFRILPIKA